MTLRRSVLEFIHHIFHVLYFRSRKGRRRGEATHTYPKQVVYFHLSKKYFPKRASVQGRVLSWNTRSSGSRFARPSLHFFPDLIVNPSTLRWSKNPWWIQEPVSNPKTHLESGRSPSRARSLYGRKIWKTHPGFRNDILWCHRQSLVLAIPVGGDVKKKCFLG